MTDPPRRPGPVVFERQPLAHRGAARRLALGVAAASMLVVVAVAKPWAAPTAEDGREPTRLALEPSPVAPSPADRASPAVAPTLGPPPWAGEPGPARSDVARVLTHRDRWGVRFVVDGPETARAGAARRDLEERWRAAGPMPAGTPAFDASSPGIALGAEGRSVRLIGLTQPPDATIEGVDVVVARPLGRTAPVPVREVRVPVSGTASVLLMPRGRDAWPPGVYQLRIDLGARRTAVTVSIFRRQAPATGEGTAG